MTQQTGFGRCLFSQLSGIGLIPFIFHTECDRETPKHHRGGIPGKLQPERTARVWISRVQKRASKLTRKRWGSGSSSSSKKSSRTLGESSPAVPAQANLFLTPPPRSPTLFTPPPSPADFLPLPPTPPTLPPLVTHAPPPPLHRSAHVTPPAPSILSMPSTEEVGSLTPSRRRSSAISVICDMCFEFLQLDDRPTAMLEVQPTISQPDAVDKLKVRVLFMNPAFEHLKSQLKLDFESPASMGGILQQAGGKLVWVVPNGDWELRCVSISRGAVTGGDRIATSGGGHRWWKVMTASPIIPSERRLVPKDEAEEHLDTLSPAKKATVPEARPDNYNCAGKGDVLPIAEDITTNRLGGAGDWTHSSSKTITPSHTSTKRSLDSSTATSRRSSRSLPTSRRDSSSVGIPEAVAEGSESLSTAPESVVGGGFGHSSNMDWTRGAMPRKNTRDLAGMDEHLNFLMSAPW